MEVEPDSPDVAVALPVPLAEDEGALPEGAALVGVRPGAVLLSPRVAEDEPVVDELDA